MGGKARRFRRRGRIPAENDLIYLILNDNSGFLALKRKRTTENTVALYQSYRNPSDIERIVLFPLAKVAGKAVPFLFFHFEVGG